MNNLKSTFDAWFWTSLAVFILIIIFICFLPKILTEPGNIDFRETGQIGDTIGGIMGPFVAIAASVLTFIAFWVQFKANIQQRNDIALERFESNLFEMIHVQQDIVSELLLEKLDSNNNVVRSEKGRDVFQFAYEDLQQEIMINNSLELITLKKALDKSDDVRKEISNLPNLWFLDHYYRHLYRIFKYINDADTNIVDNDKKQNYAGIVRATLSPYELVMLYYNSFSHPSFKRLMDTYKLLDNIRPSLLATQNDQSFFTHSS